MKYLILFILTISSLNASAICFKRRAINSQSTIMMRATQEFVNEATAIDHRLNLRFMALRLNHQIYTLATYTDNFLNSCSYLKLQADIINSKLELLEIEFKRSETSIKNRLNIFLDRIVEENDNLQAIFF